MLVVYYLNYITPKLPPPHDKRGHSYELQFVLLYINDLTEIPTTLQMQ